MRTIIICLITCAALAALQPKSSIAGGMTNGSVIDPAFTTRWAVGVGGVPSVEGDQAGNGKTSLQDGKSNGKIMGGVPSIEGDHVGNGRTVVVADRMGNG